MWENESIKIATDNGIEEVNGLVAKGLGIVLIRKQEHVFAPQPIYAVIHLGSGHELLRIRASSQTACEIATDMLSLGDWEFSGLDGYRNRDPDLPQKLTEMVIKYRGLIMIASNGEDGKLASKIARDRQ